MTTTPVPNEQTPLLGGLHHSVIEGVAEPESEVSTLAGSRTPSIKGRNSVDVGPDVVKKTPLPWGQLSIILVLELAEPLTAQVISPVSTLVGLSSPLLLWRRLIRDHIER